MIHNSNSVSAQTTLCGSTTTQPRAEGLVTAKSLTGKFYTSSGACIIDEKASFVLFRTNYDTLKSLYFTQAKESSSLKKVTIVGNATQGSFILSTNSVVHVTGNLTLSGAISGSSTGIVFIDGKLDITQDFIYGGGNYGVVFVVKGDVIIAPTVTTVNAVIISEGIIYTAGEFCSTSSTNALQLTINGSLISLNPDNRIRFCRNLTDNSQPAEIVNHQPKYVVILRKILWERLKKYTEITGAAPPAAPTTTPTPTPSLYVDNDGDGYGIGIPVTTCPTGKTCVTNNQDCWDANANAKPGQTACFRTHRGDGSFDYDCSETITIAKDSACTGVANRCFTGDLNNDGINEIVVSTGYRDSCGGTTYDFCYTILTPLTSSDCGTAPWATDDVTHTYYSGGCGAYGTKYDAYPNEIFCR